MITRRAARPGAHTHASPRTDRALAASACGGLRYPCTSTPSASAAESPSRSASPSHGSHDEEGSPARIRDDERPARDRRAPLVDRVRLRLRRRLTASDRAGRRRRRARRRGWHARRRRRRDALRRRRRARRRGRQRADDAGPPPPHETLSPSEFRARATPGATIDNVTVTGSVRIDVADLTVRRCEIQGTIDLGAGARHVTIADCSAVDFVAEGADDITLTGNTFDAGPGGSCQCFIWPGRSRRSVGRLDDRRQHVPQLPVRRAALRGALHRGVRAARPHRGQHVHDNGNTSHIFFTWCDSHGDCAEWGGGYKDPHDWAVRGNTFYDTWTAYYAISSREELAGNPSLRSAWTTTRA